MKYKTAPLLLAGAILVTPSIAEAKVSSRVSSRPRVSVSRPAASRPSLSRPSTSKPSGTYRPSTSTSKPSTSIKPSTTSKPTTIKNGTTTLKPSKTNNSSNTIPRVPKPSANKEGTSSKNNSNLVATNKNTETTSLKESATTNKVETNKIEASNPNKVDYSEVSVKPRVTNTNDSQYEPKYYNSYSDTNRYSMTPSFLDYYMLSNIFKSNDNVTERDLVRELEKKGYTKEEIDEILKHQKEINANMNTNISQSVPKQKETHKKSKLPIFLGLGITALLTGIAAIVLGRMF